MQSLSQLISGLNDLLFFRSIVYYIDARLVNFMEHTLGRVFSIVGAFALVFLTLWIMWYGYQLVTGNSQASAKDFVFKAVKAWIVIVIAFATGAAATMGLSVRTVTTDMTSLISEALSGSDAAAACINKDTGNDKYGLMGCKIDKNLTRTQAAMAFVSQLDTANDPILEDKKTRASLFAGVGVGGPAIVAGALMLTLKVANSLFICLGPIFIMCLLTKQTAPLFWKWLYYGLSTMFATAMLAVVSDISMDLVENISGALFVSNIFNEVLGGTSATSGVMQASLQQFGLGLILSTLLITTPPMAGSFFSQMMGSFQAQSSFREWAGGTPSQAPSGSLGSAGVPVSSTMNKDVTPVPNNTSSQIRTGADVTPPANPANAYIPNNNTAVNKDVIKTDSQVGNASKGMVNSELAQADRVVKEPPPSPPAPNPPKANG